MPQKVFFSVMTGAFTVGNALPFLNTVSTAIGSASTIFGIIDRIPPIDSYSAEGIIPDKLDGKITLKDVQFVYPTRPEVKVNVSPICNFKFILTFFVIIMYQIKLIS